jgi:hypothetical protein
MAARRYGWLPFMYSVSFYKAPTVPRADRDKYLEDLPVSGFAALRPVGQH